MINKSLVHGSMAILALGLLLGVTGCNTPVDASSTKTHSPATLGAQHDAGGNPAGSTPAGPAGSH